MNASDNVFIVRPENRRKTRGIIARLLSFSRGATNQEFVFSYDNYAVGVVVRIGRGKGARWQIQDEPEFTGATREEAVTNFLSCDLMTALPASHKEG